MKDSKKDLLARIQAQAREIIGQNDPLEHPSGRVLETHEGREVTTRIIEVQIIGYAVHVEGSGVVHLDADRPAWFADLDSARKIAKELVGEPDEEESA